MQPKSPEVSAHMRKIRTKRTTEEDRIRAALRRHHIRFRGNVKSLPGSPDFVLREHRVVIFVDGCFWHGCPWCFRPPIHNREWWLEKIARNQKRDRRDARRLRARGYSVVRAWAHDDPEKIVRRVLRVIEYRGK